MSNYDRIIFYENDFKTFIDILLPRLQSKENNALKENLLQCLDRVTECNE